jgi:nucleotide-binding universal stress UspA family protein
MKTILVPTDFSDHALFALKVAAILARKIKARIKLVHVFNLPSRGVSDVSYYQSFFNEIKVEAEQKLKELAKLQFLDGITVDCLLQTDKLIWQFVAGEKFKKISLIVMGAFGESGFSKVFIGSNTDKIVRMTDVPVLTIKNDPDKFDINKVVFASDFEEESYPAFKRVKFLLDVLKPTIHLLRVITPSDFEPTPVTMKKMQEFIRHFSLKKSSVNIFNYNKVETGIIAFSHGMNADLIIIPTHGRTGLAHFISRSLAESLVRHESKPILSIKIPAQPEIAVTKLTIPLNYETWGNE